MRTVNRHVFPIILLVALVVAGAAPAAAQEAVAGPPSTVDESADEQARPSGKDSRVRAKLVVDCKSKKSKHSNNKKVKKFCRGKGHGGNGGRDAVSAQGSNQQTFNCGTVEFSVDAIGRGSAESSFWGQSTLGNVLD